MRPRQHPPRAYQWKPPLSATPCSACASALSRRVASSVTSKPRSARHRRGEAPAEAPVARAVRGEPEAEVRRSGEAAAEGGQPVAELARKAARRLEAPRVGVVAAEPRKGLAVEQRVHAAEGEAPRAWVSDSESPRSVAGRGSKPNPALAPHSRKPGASWATRARPLRSKRRPRSGAARARPPPMSAPNPVSASPPSRRTPTSNEGVSDAPVASPVPSSPSAKGREPSTPKRSSHTSASASARLPPSGARAASDVVRVKRPSP